MIQVEVNGVVLDMPSSDKEGIELIKRIADIYDVSVCMSSYSPGSYTVPKTPTNTRAFGFLGISGDASRIPYEKVPIRVSFYGFPIVKAGWLSMNEVNDTGYRFGFLDGIIDFFKAIENKTMGSDLDLSQFAHEKNIETVVASFNNDFYKYLVADFNGKNIATVEGVTGINIDYLVPCFSVKKLWDLIFSTFGYAYNESKLSFMEGLYITYPKPPQEGYEPQLIAEFHKGYFVVSSGSMVPALGGGQYSASQQFWDNSNVTEGEVLYNWSFVLPEDSGYTFVVSTEAYYQSDVFGVMPATIALIVNGTIINSIPTDSLMEVSFTATESYNAGTVVQVQIAAPTPPGNGELHHNNTTLNVFKVALGEVSLIEPFKDFQIKDFIKEVLWRTGLIPVMSEDYSYIDFISMSERLDLSRAVDWSDKYIRRTDETYRMYNNAQRNIFKLKHNDENDTRGDGYLYTNDKTLPASQIIVNSKIYAPEPGGFTFTNSAGGGLIRSNVYKIWDREAKANTEGNIEIDYKGLSGRFYFVRSNMTDSVLPYNLVSEVLVVTQQVDNVPYATNEETLFDELVFKNWKDYEGVIQNHRRHRIELGLSLVDILQLDLTAPYYFRQEGQYYMLNQIWLKFGKVSHGEFIRINTVK